MKIPGLTLSLIASIYGSSAYAEWTSSFFSGTIHWEEFGGLHSKDPYESLQNIRLNLPDENLGNGSRPFPLSRHAHKISRGLKDLIASVEAGTKGYDSVILGARRLPPKPPTRMTLAEILDWVAATPGQNHAIGRYQFIPSTLKSLMHVSGTSRGAMFTPALQDQFADILLADAGFHRFIKGELPKTDFMHKLARIWAGLPTSQGRSHYHGISGNRAGMSWAQFSSAMTHLINHP